MADAALHTALHTPVPVRASSPMAGALLLTIGGWLLARQLLDVGVASLGLLVGAVLVGGWVRSRRPVLLLVGAPLAGAAAGMVVAGLAPPTARATAVLAGLAVGYAAAAPVRRSAAVPAVGTAALALAASGVDLDRVLPASAAGVVLAAAAIAAGSALVVRPRVTRAVAVPAAAALLAATTVALAVIAQSAVAGVLGDTDSSATVTTTQAIELPALDGRPLVVVAPTATTVLRSGPLGGTATADGPAGLGGALPAVVEVVERGDRVEVRQLDRADTRVSLTVDLPAGASATVLGGTGHVMTDIDGHAVEVETTSGAVTVDGHAGRLLVSTTSGAAALSLAIGEGDDVAVRSESGDVDVHVTGSPRITAEAGALFVDGYGPPRTGVEAFSTAVGAGALTVTTTSGRAAIVAVDAAG